MKKIVLLLVVAFLFTGCQLNNVDTENTKTLTAEASNQDTKSQAENMELAGFYSSVNHEEYKNILTNPGNNLYYFYQETCSHCNELKPTMLKFNKELKGQEDVYLYFVDMKAEENQDAWTTDKDYDYTDYASMKTYKDVKIQGTPTMIYVKDGEVVQYGVGSDQIESIMTIVENEFGIESQR